MIINSSTSTIFELETEKALENVIKKVRFFTPMDEMDRGKKSHSVDRL